MAAYRAGNETRTALYKSAKEMFYQKGYYQTSIKDIITNINSKLGLFSYYFESKEAIALEILSDVDAGISLALYRELGEDAMNLDPLVLNMVEQRAHATCYTCNQNIRLFFTDISTTPLFLQQRRKEKQQLIDSLCTRFDLMQDQMFEEDGMFELSCTLAFGMEVQLFRDLCQERVPLPPEKALDRYFDVCYPLFIRDAEKVRSSIAKSRQIMNRFHVTVTENFNVNIAHK